MSRSRRHWPSANQTHAISNRFTHRRWEPAQGLPDMAWGCYRSTGISTDSQAYCMIVSCSEMKALEATAFAKGVSPEALMEEAGRQIALAVQHFFPAPGDCAASVGKGHNAGDALVAL